MLSYNVHKGIINLSCYRDAMMKDNKTNIESGHLLTDTIKDRQRVLNKCKKAGRKFVIHTSTVGGMSTKGK